MLGKAMETGLNDQLKMELASAYLYLSMAAWCEASDLPGMAHWLQGQAKEELAHGMKIYGYIVDRGGQVALQAIAQPPLAYESPVQVFAQALAHEQKVTASINALCALAAQEQDFASQAFLQWFVTEQVEEEKSATQVLAMVKRAGGEGPVLLLVDRELGQRGA